MIYPPERKKYVLYANVQNKHDCFSLLTDSRRKRRSSTFHPAEILESHPAIDFSRCLNSELPGEKETCNIELFVQCYYSLKKMSYIIWIASIYIYIYTSRYLPAVYFSGKKKSATPRYVWPPSLVLRWWRAARSVSRRPSRIPRVANSIHPRSHLSCQHPKSGGRFTTRNCGNSVQRFGIWDPKKKHGILLGIFWHQKWIESSANGSKLVVLGVDFGGVGFFMGSPYETKIEKKCQRFFLGSKKKWDFFFTDLVAPVFLSPLFYPTPGMKFCWLPFYLAEHH